jgi:hypothetical protein
MTSLANQESDLSQSFWQRAAELGALDEQQRLAGSPAPTPAPEDGGLEPLLHQASPLQHCRTGVSEGVIRSWRLSKAR